MPNLCNNELNQRKQVPDLKDEARNIKKKVSGFKELNREGVEKVLKEHWGKYADIPYERDERLISALVCIFKKIGIPTRLDINALEDRVDRLSDMIAAMGCRRDH